MTVDSESRIAIPTRLAERGAAAATNPVTGRTPSRRRMLMAGPVLAIFALLSALFVTDAAGLPIRDPDHVAGRRLLMVLCLVAVLIALDVLVRAGRRSPGLRPCRAAIQSVRRERWTPLRGIAVGSALVSFYVTYLSYRNLKSVVPVLRPGDLFDHDLADLDRSLFGGHDPAVLLHGLLGIGVQTHLLSGAYMLLFAFIPGTLAFALVFSRNLASGLYYVTAQSINWLLAAASYFLLPALGPVYAEPSVFAHLPVSTVTRLQDLLLDQRVEFLRDPATGTAQSIAAFPSLHVSFFFTAALASHLLGLARPVRIGAWFLLGVTIAATVYLGWHYFVDDLAGLALGAIALVLARALTGLDLRGPRGLSRSEPTPT